MRAPAARLEPVRTHNVENGTPIKMNVRDITWEEALILISREESHFFDKKSRDVAPRQIEKLAVAFANADGGELVIGIADAKEEPIEEKRWVGFESIELINAHLQSLFALNPALDLRYELLKRNNENHYVLKVAVEKGSSVHKTSDNTVYQRLGAQSLPIKEPDRIAALSFAKGAASFEDTALSEITPDELVDSHELSTFLRDYSPRTDPLEFLLGQNLLHNKTWEPRVAGTLLFAGNPGTVIPRKCAVKIARYETREDDPERDHLAHQETIEGPSYPLIHATVDRVRKIMSSVQVWTREGLRHLDYPPEAIWETIVNAVIHRDYSISDDIHILIFDNRIEINSPGRLPGYVNVKNILDARYSRNPKIVRTLNRYKTPPNKDLGEGLNTTFQKMKEWGLKEPWIEEQGNYVKVVLPHSPLAAPTEAILDFLQHEDLITNRQARELTGIRSENLVKIEFYKLRDEGLLERVPDLHGPKSAWRLTKLGREKVFGA
ncbi:MAG: ATP-binding protein [Rhodomicrobium sp.]